MTVETPWWAESEILRSIANTPNAIRASLPKRARFGGGWTLCLYSAAFRTDGPYALIVEWNDRSGITHTIGSGESVKKTASSSGHGCEISINNIRWNFPSDQDESSPIVPAVMFNCLDPKINRQMIAIIRAWLQLASARNVELIG